MQANCWLAHPFRAWGCPHGRDTKRQTASPATSSPLRSHCCPPSHQPGSWGICLTPHQPHSQQPEFPEPGTQPVHVPPGPLCPPVQPVPWPGPQHPHSGHRSNLFPALPASRPPLPANVVTPTSCSKVKSTAQPPWVKLCRPLDLIAAPGPLSDLSHCTMVLPSSLPVT